MSESRERCNCDASCGENRYHDRGEPCCVWYQVPRYLWHLDISTARLAWLHDEWPSEIKDRKVSDKQVREMKKGSTRVSDKLSKVGESFTINMYDNGYMVEVNGKDAKDDWKTSKLMVSNLDELTDLVREITSMERDS